MLLTTVPEVLRERVEQVASSGLRVLDACLDTQYTSGLIRRMLQQIKSDAGRGEYPCHSDDTELYRAYKNLSKASMLLCIAKRGESDRAIDAQARVLLAARQRVASLLVERNIPITGKYKKAYDSQNP